MMRLMMFQAAAEGQKIGSLFSLVENYKILDNYSQPFKQSTTDEIVGFVAALTKVNSLALSVQLIFLLCQSLIYCL